jgi:phosphohistidine phosphatase
MRYLYLLRHTHAVSNAPGQERMLDKKGITQAEELAEYIRKYPKIDLVKSSESMRTQQTYEYLFKALGYNTDNYKTFNLVNASNEKVLSEILDTKDHVNNLMILGHYPGILLVTQLLNVSMEATWEPLIFENTHLGNIVVIKSDADKWENFTNSNNQIVDIHWPKQ